MEEINNKLMSTVDEALLEAYEELNDYECDSEQYRNILQSIKELTEIKIKLTEQQIKNDTSLFTKRDAVLKYGIQIGIFAMGMIIQNSWIKSGFRFEEEGVYKSQTFRNVFNNSLRVR